MAGWRKSTYSGSNTNCVEVAFGTDHVGVRDSKNPGAAALVFPVAEWASAVSRVRCRTV
jgi:hypothetical protein